MNQFDGKLHAKKIEENILVPLAKTHGGKLLIIQVGDNPVSEKYINLKMNLCSKLRITCILEKITDFKDKDFIRQRVQELFNKDEVTGGIIQLPLPDHELYDILDLIPSEKDLDLLSSYSQSQFYAGNFSKLPPVVKAVQYFMKQNALSYNMKIYVIGHGFLVGKPVSFFLKSKGAEVTVIEDYHQGQKLDCQMAILSAGIPNLVKGLDLPSNCHVIDFGSSVIEGKTIGDLDMNTSVEHLGVVSASPGGMGPLVVRFLIHNFLQS